MTVQASDRLPLSRILLPMLGVLAIALIGRVLLLATGTVSFHSDESVVALMARHILQGDRPVFFYGQAYMGSLDAWLVAVGFAMFGESVLSIRIIQSALYLLIVATGFLVAYRFSGRITVAVIAGLTIAIPNTLVALYTTATLGGYNEMLLLGNLILLLGYPMIRDIADGNPPRLWQWATLGFVTGVGWWVNGLIIAYAVPVGLLLLYRIIRSKQPVTRFMAPILVALIAFVLGGAPWWAFNFEHDFAALRFYLPGSTPSEFAGGDVPPLTTVERLVGLFLLGMPAVIGLRYPWARDYLAPNLPLMALAILVLAIFLASVYMIVRRGRTSALLKPDARTLLLIGVGFFAAVFIFSRFSADPTGRYFLPLMVYFATMIGVFAASLPKTWIRAAVVGLLLVYHAVGLGLAVANNPPGVTTQFNLDTHLPNDDDDALIAFLQENGLEHGYTNYWIAFRLAFLSEETLIYRAALPYKPDLTYTPRDDRYAPYVEAVNDAQANGERLAYVTANIAEARAWLEAFFAEQGVTYSQTQVGMYTVYYDFTPRVPVPPEQFAE